MILRLSLRPGSRALSGCAGPAWGYHGYEYPLTLGNLLQDIAGEEAARQSHH